MGARATSGPFGSASLALAVVGAACLWASEAPTLKGRFLGGEPDGGVWLGVVGDGAEEANWSHVEEDHFEVPLPPGQEARVVAIAKDRVPLVVAVPPGSQDRRAELRLLAGLVLEGTVHSEDGRPLRNVEIRVTPSDAVALKGLSDAGYAVSLRETRIELPPIGKWETDREGVFHVGGLELGRHYVEASAKGYVPVLLKDVAIREEAANRLDLVLFRAFFVTGHVVDYQGVPVVDAEVRADWVQPSEARHRVGGDVVHRQVRRRTTGRTGDDGSFRLGPFQGGPDIEMFATSEDLGSSRRRVLAPYDGLVLQLRRHVVRGRVVDAATGEPLEMFHLKTHRYARTHTIRHSDGHFEVPVDPDTGSFHIEAPGYFVWFARFFAGSGGEYDIGEITLERDRTITGRVRNARTREPIAGALVRRAWQHHDDALGVFTMNWFGNRGAETRTDGTFRLGLLPTGPDRLEVRGRVEGRVFVRVVDLPPDVSHFDIDLAFDSVIAGTMALPDGRPVEGTVRLWHSLGNRWERKVASNGVFRWEGLGGGQYRLSAESDEGVVESRAVVLGDGEAAENVRLVVEPGGRIFGTVDGLLRGEFMMVAVRDRNGRTVLSRELENGAYSLRGIPDLATLTARTTLERVLARQVRLNDQGEARTNLDFSGGSRLVGTVGAGARPLRGVNLAVVPEDRSRPVVYATTDEVGRYAADGISDGPHSVQTQTGQSFDVYVEQRTTLDIELPQNSLLGTVRDGRTGRPVAGGWVRLVSADATAESRRPVLRVRVASDGRFSFQGLAEGAYTWSLLTEDEDVGNKKDKRPLLSQESHRRVP